jgi:hypothetical protein
MKSKKLKRIIQYCCFQNRSIMRDNSWTLCWDSRGMMPLNVVSRSWNVAYYKSRK